MQQTLLVTMQSPQQTLDVELPGDVPLSDLFPVLLEMCGISSQAWTLYSAATNGPLTMRQTLFDNGILNGETLFLQAQDEFSLTRMQTREGSPKTIVPGEESGGIGITWKKEW